MDRHVLRSQTVISARMYQLASASIVRAVCVVGRRALTSRYLCDECDMAYHLWCLEPALESIPDCDEWLVWLQYSCVDGDEFKCSQNRNRV